MAGLVWATVHASCVGASLTTGEAVYDFYCYQCHGYSGDARTLASTYLKPPPRNFTRADSSTLTRTKMLDAVANGRPGTGMVSFARVLDQRQIERVVDFIRGAFMTQSPRRRVYHSVANGWPNHEHYRAAFPFATGEIPLDVTWEDLDPEQVAGKRLYLNACISCHDRAHVTQEGPVWESHAVSYPRKHYSHRATDLDGRTGATPYAQHERRPDSGSAGDAVARGERLFQDNCAFCHAADGTGRHWIGSFLMPRPRDLTGARVAGMTAAQLRRTIREGLPGTSMPGWKHVLEDGEITDVVTYLRRALRGRTVRANDAGPAAKSSDAHHEPLSWRRQDR